MNANKCALGAGVLFMTCGSIIGGDVSEKADFISDSTQSLDEQLRNTPIRRPGTYAPREPAAVRNHPH